MLDLLGKIVDGQFSRSSRARNIIRYRTLVVYTRSYFEFVSFNYPIDNF